MINAGQTVDGLTPAFDTCGLTSLRPTLPSDTAHLHGNAHDSLKAPASHVARPTANGGANA
jgi:hypothetical protein